VIRRAPFRRDARGGFVVDLRDPQRELVCSLAPQLRGALQGDAAPDDPAVARLFPAAYPDDPLRNLEFNELASDDLVAGRLERLDVLDRTIGARHVSEDELSAWMLTLNDVRLVLGTRLDVTEESRPGDFEGDEDSKNAFAVYSYLSALVDAIVEALGDPVA